MKKSVIGLFIVFWAVSSFAQIDSLKKIKPQLGAYWEHKITLFEILPNDTGEIIFLGNSITDCNEWAEMFCNPKIKNRGISGDITDGVLYRLDEVVESYPAKIFLMIGVNDLAKQKDVAYIEANYRKILNYIHQKSPKTVVYIQNVLPVNDKFEGFKNHVSKSAEILMLNKAIEKMAKEYSLTYIDLFSLMVDKNGKLREDLTQDGLHLNGNAYLIWKAAIEKYVNE